MDFIFYIAIFFFVILPIIKNASKNKKPAKKNQYGKSHDEVKEQLAMVRARMSSQGGPQQVFGKKNQYGHNQKRQRTHNDLHSGDGDVNVFSKSHKARVDARNVQDRVKRQALEESIHGKKNKGITRAGNKGRSDWGARDKSGNSIFALLLLGAIVLGAYYFIINFADKF